MEPREADAAAAVAARIREKLARARALGEPPAAPDPEAILRQRARELAQTIRPPEEGERLEVVEFRLGRERLAFESAWVMEVVMLREPVQVPGAPAFFAGIINLRGRILSLLDLRQLLGLPPPPAGELPGAILVLADRRTEVGIVADRVEAVREISGRALSPPPPTLPPPALRYRRGVIPGGVSLLDARLLLASPQLRREQPNDTDSS